jgi:cytochrome d ubiquinol oxidase subunit II
LVLFAFLAAAYLTVDARIDPAVQEDFRKRALFSQLTLLPVAVLVFFTSKQGAPEMYRGLTNWWAPLLLIWTSLFALVAAGTLWRRNFRLARLSAAGQVATILLGWCFAQYPSLLYPDLTVHNSAAPEATLRLLVIALGLGVAVLLPSLYFLFYIFKGRPLTGAED